MFDVPFDVLAVMLAIAAFLIALKASNQATSLRRRLDALEAAALTPRPVQPPPLTPQQELEQTLATAAPPAVEPAPEAELAPPLARVFGRLGK